MRKLLHTLLLLLSVVSAMAHPKEEELPLGRLLVELDNVIGQKQDYQAARFRRADSLMSVVSLTDGAARIDALKQLYDTYLHFQTDSTLSVLNRFKNLPEYNTDVRLQQYVTLNEATVYGMMGLYYQAFLNMNSVALQPIDDETRLHYYNALHSVLGWMGEYTEAQLPDLSHGVLQRALAYHDSIASLEPDPLNRSIVRSNLDYDLGNYRQCIDTLNYIMLDCDPARRIFVFSRLSEAYGKLGIADEQLRYLILTAIEDLRAGVTEYMALPQLASKLYERGETERAYNYMFCAFEDANLCKASLRTVEVTQFFPIINQSHHENINSKRRNTYIIIALLTILAGALTGIVLVLLRLNRKLASTRRMLAEANERLRQSNIQLKEANTELTRTDKIKEEYLTSYLTRSRRYLASTESMQRQFLKLLQARQLDELQKQLKSTQLIEEEQQRFYEDFDETFLHLYPNFVEKFNALLKPDCRIYPKRGELLTTELRIFALIRMGETDSTKIAKFLNYSLTTIYNYRSRVRNNALGDKETFEQNVIEL